MPQSAAGSVIGSPFLTSSAPQPNLVLLILNYHLPKSTAVFWERARLKICADGGANRLYDAAPAWHSRKTPRSARLACLPDVIKGDMDSIRPDVATFYAELGISIKDLSDDQDSTDLHKCLHCAEERLKQQGIALSNATILALGALGGRLDHTLSNINTLYMFPHINLVLCGDGSLARLLPAGKSVIKPEKRMEGPQCGVLALGQPATASSSGLKWDMDGHRLEVGGLMSTSNVIAADNIVIESTEPLLWTTEFQDDAISDT